VFVGLFAQDANRFRADTVKYQQITFVRRK
jgi:hypothetical protein